MGEGQGGFDRLTFDAAGGTVPACFRPECPMPRARMLCCAVLALFLAACASEPEKRPEDMDFFERLAKNQEEKEMSRRKAELARLHGKTEEKTRPGDGTLEYYASAKQDRGPKAPIVVTWEGLAREREIAANSKYNRPGTIRPPMKITLVSESHPDSQGLRSGRTKEGRAAGASSAVLRDADLLKFVQGLERRGFYKYAQPTETQAAALEHPRARGRVTIERNGQSMTLVSMRGQGTNPRTKEIPGIYSESKQAIMMLRNRTPGLNLTAVETDTLIPGFGN